MKDLSFFLLKNSLTFKVKKGFKNFCTGDASTSTLNQQQHQDSPEFLLETDERETVHHHQPTLEEMILQLDLEEKLMAARRPIISHRMSCVNSSDILRSARNALNQYPRFSLDGKDAMYRSSFRRNTNSDVDHGRPAKVAGERVVWCKPGVVGRLMGLEAMPIPIRLKHRMKSCLVIRKKQNLMRSKPVAFDVDEITTAPRDEVGWPMGRFV